MAMNLRVLLALLFVALTGVPTAAAPDQKADAETLWEQAIAAKGGRENLLAVRSLVVTERGSGRSPRCQGDNVLQTLYVFPSLFWRFGCDGLGPGLLIFDFKQRVAWGDGGRLPENFVDDYFMLEGQLLFLLESASVKPDPVAVRRDTVGVRAVDVVETRLSSARIRADYYLDRESHLPLRVVVFRTLSAPPGQGIPPRDFVLEDHYRLSGYTSVEGLQMPARVSHQNGAYGSMSYRLNVAYDEQVFIDAANDSRRSLRWALDAWEKK
jgi:hypothetical protein